LGVQDGEDTTLSQGIRHIIKATSVRSVWAMVLWSKRAANTVRHRFRRRTSARRQEFRKARNVSQEKLALDAGFDRTFLSLLERGLRGPTMRTLIALAAELDVRLSETVQRMEELLPK